MRQPVPEQQFVLRGAWIRGEDMPALLYLSTLLPPCLYLQQKPCIRLRPAPRAGIVQNHWTIVRLLPLSWHCACRSRPRPRPGPRPLSTHHCVRPSPASLGRSWQAVALRNARLQTFPLRRVLNGAEAGREQINHVLV